MDLFDRVIQQLSIQADFFARRHKVIVSNITNLDVKGYEAKDLSFSGELGSAMDKKGGLVRTDPKHLPSPNQAGGHQVVATGEKVRIDQEMVNLAENQLRYNLSIEILARKFRALNNLLKEAK